MADGKGGAPSAILVNLSVGDESIQLDAVQPDFGKKLQDSIDNELKVQRAGVEKELSEGKYADFDQLLELRAGLEDELLELNKAEHNIEADADVKAEKDEISRLSIARLQTELTRARGRKDGSTTPKKKDNRSTRRLSDASAPRSDDGEDSERTLNDILDGQNRTAAKLSGGGGSIALDEAMTKSLWGIPEGGGKA